VRFARFFWFYLLSRFWGFLGGGSSKTPHKSFYNKSLSKAFYQKIDEKSNTKPFLPKHPY
jgi:hypothetical protein